MNIKIGDFGISKQSNNTYALTTKKVASINYASPEILKKEYIMKNRIYIH